MSAPLTIVTGGTRGIGAAVSRRLVADGHDVVIGYRSDASAAETLATELSTSGRTAVAVCADTTDEQAVSNMFTAAAEIGTLTGLVNNAGSARAVGKLADNDIETIRADLDVNLIGVITCCKYAIAAMAESGGAIVNISSAAATLGSPGMYVHYAAAKAAVDTLTVGLSKEVAAQNIRVNAVAPGIIETDFHRDRQRPQKMASNIPLGRPGVPDEIAGAVSWLLSADARYATGTVIRVAGGM
ncbi:SDR family oxidoreductase [Rhodococcus sp. IEGM 1381]|uniref:SDR family NAD(P)-dependent oxidoreductase n=1 Tax=Rhodococcus sp. IEGM 1381 TaxID=3047085 RepID=UPI0024B7D3D7|nr:SDR family oxidoreductase [Rhodococcus sp. IEGM 1381]MDI9897790.1 SDR family oxidoreductase [Rhodococcus sp. IEGM 1381]